MEALKTLPSPHPDSGPVKVLAVFDRQNKKTGGREELRITTNTFKRKYLFNVRHWFNHSPGQPESDWRAGEQGAGLREHELDDLLEALEHVRGLVRAEGRSTSQPPRVEASKGKREPFKRDRGQSVAQRDREYRKHLDRGGPAPQVPSGVNGRQTDFTDDLAEFRR